jgi:hypothetical protein
MPHSAAFSGNTNGSGTNNSSSSSTSGSNMSNSGNNMSSSKASEEPAREGDALSAGLRRWLQGAQKKVMAETRAALDEWLVAAMHIIDGSTYHHHHVPGNTPQACKKFKQTCSRSVCGQLVVCVTAGDMNLSRDEVLETMQDASGFPDSVRVVGNTRDFLIGMLSAQQLAAALPTAHANMHVGVGAIY